MPALPPAKTETVIFNSLLRFVRSTPSYQAMVDLFRDRRAFDLQPLIGTTGTGGAKSSISRQEKLVGGIDLKSAVGIEIGALTSPIVRREDGNVFYIDHADTETIRNKYKNAPHIDQSSIVEIDMVWGSQTLQECIGIGRKVDYVVNSHVVEHVPDLVTWLQEILSILKPGGHLRMAVPDRRFTFDFLRRESTLVDALDAYVRRARAPLPRAILDHFLHYTEINHAEAWSGILDSRAIKPHSPPHVALKMAESAYRFGEYHDTHCWVFTPVSFATLCAELCDLGLLRMECATFHETQFMEIEFFVGMKPQTDISTCVTSWRRVVDRLLLNSSHG